MFTGVGLGRVRSQEGVGWARGEPSRAVESDQLIEGRPARRCSSGGYGQCRQPLPQQLPFASNAAAVNTWYPVAGST